MAELSELTNDGTYVFNFLNRGETLMLQANVSTENNTDNKLIAALGHHFLNSGTISQCDVSEKIGVRGTMSYVFHPKTLTGSNILFVPRSSELRSRMPLALMKS